MCMVSKKNEMHLLCDATNYIIMLRVILKFQNDAFYKRKVNGFLLSG